MKILIVNTFYYPNIIGGTENSVKILAENLVKSGHEVAVYCIDSQKDSLYIEEINGVKIFRGTGGIFNTRGRLNINSNKMVKVYNKIIELRNYSIKKEVDNVINSFNPEIIHTNNLYGISPYIWKLAKQSNIKIVHTLRDYWIASPTNKLEVKDNILFKIYRGYFIKCSKYVDFVTAPSRFTLDIFKDYKYFWNSKFYHINNAIEIDKALLKNIIDKKREKEDEIINFVFVGVLAEHKGIDKLLKIFNSNSNKNIRLNICGDGELLSEVNRYIQKDTRISYKGKLNKKELNEELYRNDVLIIPSMWDEPFGRVVIEGNQNGLPVIGSARGGIKEILDNIETGMLFDSEKLEELDKLINYFTNRDNIKKYYNNILNNIDKYSVEKQVEEFYKIYIK